MKLSVVIPVHDQARFLREACLSALAEGPCEILVVDDGSEDHPREVIADLPIRFLRLAERKGVAAARNFGARHASGEYLAFLDGDDRLVPGGLRWRLDFLEASPDRNFVAGVLARAIDEAGGSLGGYRFPWVDALAEPEISLAWVRRQKAVQTAAWSILFRRSFFSRLGGFDESLRHDPDTDLLLRALEKEPLPFFARGTVEYRVHSANHTRAESGEFRQSPAVLAETILANLAARAR